MSSHPSQSVQALRLGAVVHVLRSLCSQLEDLSVEFRSARQLGTASAVGAGARVMSSVAATLEAHVGQLREVA